MKQFIFILLFFCPIILNYECRANIGKSGSVVSDTDPRYSELIPLAEVCFDISHFRKLGDDTPIDGKVIISYSGFTKIAIIYFDFKDNPTSIEYRMKVLDEKCGWGMERKFYYRQYIVENMDNPSEKVLLLVTNTNYPNSYQTDPNSYRAYIFSKPIFFDPLETYIPSDSENKRIFEVTRR